MKLQTYHIPPEHAWNDEVFPILDWFWFYNSLYLQTRYGKFTGKYWKAFHFEICLFRHKFGLNMDWGWGEMTPEAAKETYHARRRKK